MNYVNGDYVTYAYDKYGNVKEKQVNGVVSYQGIADNAGDVTKSIDTLNHLQYDYVYDSTDRLISSVVTDTTTKKRRNTWIEVKFIPTHTTMAEISRSRRFMILPVVPMYSLPPTPIAMMMRHGVICSQHIMARV